MKLHLKEGLKQVDSDMYITDYVGDVVNLLINKPKPYRIVWNKIDDIYGIGNAYKYVHGNIRSSMSKNGYNGEELYDGDNCESFTFVPYLTTDNSWEVAGFEGERSNPLYIKTGIILSVGNLQTKCHDLYNKLIKNNLMINNSLDNIITVLKAYGKELKQLRKEEKDYIKRYQDAGFDIRPEYKGIPNFQYYMDLWNKSNFMWLGDRHVSIDTTQIFYYPKDRQERMEFLDALGQVYEMEGGYPVKLTTYLDGNLTVQVAKYKQIKKLLDDANIPYEVAFKYV